MSTYSSQCAKCDGTGIVRRFLDHKGGVCFDCGGTGIMRHRRPARATSATVAAPAALTIDTARHLGDLALHGRSGSIHTDTAFEAVDLFERGGYAEERADMARLAALRPIAYGGPVA